jgi:hypothetical protein
MRRSYPVVECAAIAAAFVLSMSHLAVGQPGGGTGGAPAPGKYGPPRVSSGSGFGAGSSLQLMALPEVQRALKLTVKQKKGIAQINKELVEGRRQLFQAGPGGVGGIGAGMQRLGEEAAIKLAGLLDDEQEERLQGITIQIAGANAVMIDAKLADELKITDDQKTKLQEIQQENMREMSESFRASGIPRESSRAKFEELHANGEKKLLAVLTSDQQKQLEALKGDKIKIDLMKLPGGGSGDRSRGGGVVRVPAGR